jgi:hypothetical protein
MNKRQRKKAVAIAKDVIEQLRVKRFVASSGTYCEIDYQSDDHSSFRDNHEFGDSFQKTFAKDKKVVCNVCAMGAVYIGYINRFNNVDNDEVDGVEDPEIIDTLSGIFSQDQLRLMERIFENAWISEAPEWWMDMSGEDQKDYEARCTAYHDRSTSDDGLLRTIMLNVVRNDGEFVLPKRKIK